jgi:hypothetical protein
LARKAALPKALRELPEVLTAQNNLRQAVKTVTAGRDKGQKLSMSSKKWADRLALFLDSR